MLVIGDDDQASPSNATKPLGKLLQDLHGNSKQVVSLIYEEAGHLAEPPFTPFCAETFNPTFCRINLKWTFSLFAWFNDYFRCFYEMGRKERTTRQVTRRYVAQNNQVLSLHTSNQVHRSQQPSLNKPAIGIDDYIIQTGPYCCSE